jgi:hypothetical protein
MIKISTYQRIHEEQTIIVMPSVLADGRKLILFITLKGIIWKLNFIPELCLNAMRKGG